MNPTWHQTAQSCLQFLTVFVAQLTTLAVQTGHPPETWADLYLPFLLSVAAALAIWAGSKVVLPDAA